MRRFLALTRTTHALSRSSIAAGTENEAAPASGSPLKPSANLGKSEEAEKGDADDAPASPTGDVVSVARKLSAGLSMKYDSVGGEHVPKYSEREVSVMLQQKAEELKAAMQAAHDAEVMDRRGWWLASLTLRVSDVTWA